MATIRELRTVFTAKADDLKKAFKEINDSMKNVSKEAEAAAKKTEEQWQKVGKGMQTTGKVMTGALTVPLVALATAGTASAIAMDGAYKNIRAGTGATGDALDDLKDNFKNVFNNVPESADEVSSALADLNTRTGLTGQALEDATTQFLTLGRVSGEDVPTLIANGTRAFGDWGIAVEDQGDTMDYFWKVSQTTGIGVNDLMGKMVQFGAPLRQMGFDFETSAALLGKFEKEGVNAELVMGSMRQALGKMAKEGIPAEEGLAKTVDAIKNAGSTSEANAAAIELFGARAGPDMAAAVREGRFEIDDLLATLESSDETIGKAGEDTLTFGERMQVMKNKVTTAIEPIGRVILDIAEKYLPKFEAAIMKASKWFESLGESGQKTAVLIGALVAAFGPVLLALGSVAMALAPVAAQITRMGGLAKVLAAGMKYLRVVFLAFTGPVGITVAVLAGLALLFVTLWKRSDRFREAVQKAGDKIKEFGGKVKTAFEAVKALFEGNSVKAGALLKSLGLSDEQVMKVFVVFVQLRTKAKEALDKITEFFQQTMTKIKGFWDSEGQQILSAAQNIFDGLKKGAEFLGGVLASTFRGIFKVIQFIMPAVLGLIKMVWGNIQGVITGALDIIMGAVKIFSGLFTGDFKKMWEGVKQVFFGAIRLVWNAIQLTFFGRIAKGAAAFVLTFRSFFVKMWTYLVNLFRTSVTNILTRTIQFFSNLFTRSRNIFTSFQTMLRTIWKNVQDYISGAASKIFTNTRNAFTNLKDKTAEIFRGIYNGIKDRFTDIVNAAKALPKRIGDGIGSMASKVKSGVTKVINQLASRLGDGVNGVIGGINWVLGKIGVAKSNNIPKWDVPQYAKGTPNTRGGHPGGLAVVNDGNGPEMIQDPDGSTYMLKGKNVLANLAKGTTVWSAEKTKDILDMVPHYKNGTMDALKAAGNWVTENVIAPVAKTGAKAVVGAKNIGGKVKDVALNVFDYMKDPGGLLDLALKTLGIDKPAGGTMIGDIARGGFNKIKDSALGFIKDKLTSFGASQSGIALTGGNGGGFGAPFRFTSGPGPRNTGIPGASTMHKGWDWAAPIGTPIPSVTDGVGHRTGFHPLSGNFVEVRDPNGTIHRYQHNSRNIVKVGQQVKKGQTIALVGNTGVGSGAHLHYEKRQGYADGGIVDQAQLAWIAEGGWAESIISHDPAKRVSQKAIWEQTGKELGFDTNNPAVLEALDRIRVAVEEGHVIEMDKKPIGRMIAPEVAKHMKRREGVRAIYET